MGHLLLGLYYSQRGRFPEAESALKTAQKLTPDNEVVSRNLAGIYMRQGRYKDAREQLQKTLKIMPSARAYGALMGAYYYEGRFDEAAAAMEAGIDLDSTNYSLYGNLGSAYRWSKGNEGKAEAAFRRAIELGQKALEVTPQDDNIRANLAEYWAKLGQPKKALEQLDQIPVEVRGKYAGRIAVVYELTGQRKKAIETATQLATDTVLLNEMKNEPELKGLWSDASFQAAIQKRGK